MASRAETKIPKAVAGARSARQLFSYFFRRAALWPEYGMRPRKGEVKRVVFFTAGFDDHVVDLLKRVPNLPKLVEGLEELRLVNTAITQKGTAKLRKLLPG